MTWRAAVSLLAVGTASCGASEPDWAAWLAGYFPAATCDEARFSLIESDDGISDYLYVVRIDGGECVRSLERSLTEAGAQESTIPLVHGLLLPGHDDRNYELNAFDFRSEPGSAIWTIDKT